jgi:hypothetical protein
MGMTTKMSEIRIRKKYLPGKYIFHSDFARMAYQVGREGEVGAVIARPQPAVQGVGRVGRAQGFPPPAPLPAALRPARGPLLFTRLQPSKTAGNVKGSC